MYIYYDIFKNNQENSCRTFRCRDGHFSEIYDDVYDYLTDTLEQTHEIAAEACDWADLACVGDYYEADDFGISVRD